MTTLLLEKLQEMKQLKRLFTPKEIKEFKFGK